MNVIGCDSCGTPSILADMSSEMLAELIGLLLIVSLCVGVMPSPWFLLTPLIAIPLTCVSFSIGTWVSMLNALYRDVTSLVPFALQLGLIFTPVMYQTSTIVPEKYRLLAAVNPLVTIIDLFRDAWFGQPPPTAGMILVSTLATALILSSPVEERTISRPSGARSTPARRRP